MKRSRITPAILFLATALSTPVLAQGLTPADRVAANYAAAQANLAALQAKTDSQSFLELGRLLRSGLPTSPTNPLRKPDPQGAEAAYAKAIAAGDQAGFQAAFELAGILSGTDRPDADQKRAVTLYQQAADGGIAAAAVALGQLYENGRIVAKDLDKAAQLYQLALRDNEPEGAFGMARLQAAKGASADAKSFVAQGIVQLRVRAQRSATASGNLALRYAIGDGVPRDVGQAKRLLDQAMKLGDTSAAVATAQELLPGGKLAPDPATAKSLLLGAEGAGSIAAAKLILNDAANSGALGLKPNEVQTIANHLEGFGDVEGTFLVATLYDSGHGLPQDKARSAALFDKITTLGQQDPAELSKLGRMLRNGRGVPVDHQRAFDFLAAAANAGLVPAMVDAADLALDQRNAPANVDFKEVIGWLQTAVSANDPTALVLLGDVYHDGRGVPVSLDEAAKLYDQAVTRFSLPLAMERQANILLDQAQGRTDVLRAIALLERSSGVGRGTAMDALGRLYLAGDFVAKDPAAAERWFQRGADAGYRPAMIDLGRLYEASMPPLGSRDKAYAAYERAWKAGDADGGYFMGRILRADGKVSQATDLLRQAVQHGSGVAAIELASIMLADPAYKPGGAEKLVEQGLALAGRDQVEGLQVGQAIVSLPDPKLAERGIKLLTDLDQSGVEAASRVLADIYVGARFGSFDLNAAKLWARRSAEKGSVQPLFNLANGLMRGDHDKPDIAAGVELLEEARKFAPNNMDTLVLLGRRYQTGGEGVKQDVIKAASLFEKAAELGSTTGEVLVARAYAEGSGVPTDPDRAILWFGRAADQGSLEAMMELGRYYAAGEGVKLDAERAFGFFFKAATAGSVEAMVEVGKSMLVGYGTFQDVPRGIQWLEKAAGDGSVGAMYDLFQFYNLPDPRTHDNAKALQWIKAAAQNGSGEAAFRLALLYRDGQVVPKDFGQMESWLKQAAKSGHQYSAKLLQKRGELDRLKTAADPDTDPDDNLDE